MKNMILPSRYINLLT